jgi:hypothetical protein
MLVNEIHRKTKITKLEQEEGIIVGDANLKDYGPVHLSYNPSYSACFFSRNNIFLSQKISQQCFSAGL